MHMRNRMPVDVVYASGDIRIPMHMHIYAWIRIRIRSRIYVYVYVYVYNMHVYVYIFHLSELRVRVLCTCRTWPWAKNKNKMHAHMRAHANSIFGLVVSVKMMTWSDQKFIRENNNNVKHACIGSRQKHITLSSPQINCTRTDEWLVKIMIDACNKKTPFSSLLLSLTHAHTVPHIHT